MKRREYLCLYRCRNDYYRLCTHYIDAVRKDIAVNQFRLWCYENDVTFFGVYLND